MYIKNYYSSRHDYLELKSKLSLHRRHFSFAAGFDFSTVPTKYYGRDGRNFTQLKKEKESSFVLSSGRLVRDIKFLFYLFVG